VTRDVADAVNNLRQLIAESLTAAARAVQAALEAADEFAVTRAVQAALEAADEFAVTRAVQAALEAADEFAVTLALAVLAMLRTAVEALRELIVKADALAHAEWEPYRAAGGAS
jgi:hypothetical protein